jgi:RHS repeat-associated protein
MALRPEQDSGGGFLSRSIRGANADPFGGFKAQHGYDTDYETGLQLLTYRYYDSGTERFVNCDPIQVGSDLISFLLVYTLSANGPEGNRKVTTMRKQMMRDETRHITMRNKSAPSEDKPPGGGIVPTPTVLSGPIGVQDGPPDPQSFQKATRLLARLPQWRKGRHRLYRFGLWISPIPSFLLWRYLIGPDWWQGVYGIGVVWIAYILAYVKLWEWLSVKYNRAISVVLNASAEPSVGPIIDACCLLAVPPEVKRALIDRLGRVTSPDDVSLTDLQITVLHEIVQGRRLPTSFDTASHCIILNALVYMGDARSVACLEELVGGGGKARENEVVRATAQQCLVRLHARLAAESLRASLLRSSEQTSLHSATLLRPATTEADATASEQLLRAHSEPLPKLHARIAGKTLAPR